MNLSQYNFIIKFHDGDTKIFYIVIYKDFSIFSIVTAMQSVFKQHIYLFVGLGVIPDNTQYICQCNVKVDGKDTYPFIALWRNPLIK